MRRAVSGTVRSGRSARIAPGALEMSEYLVDDFAVVDERDDVQFAATARTQQWLDLVYAAEESRPGPRAGRRRGRRLIDNDLLLVSASSCAAHHGVGPK